MTGRRHMCLAAIAAVAGAAAVALLASPAASLATGYYGEGVGTSHPLSITSVPAGIVKASDGQLELARSVLAKWDTTSPLWSAPGLTPDPRTAVPLTAGSGDLLIADGRFDKFVARVNAAGTPVWKYTGGALPGGGTATLSRPFSAQPFTFRGHTCVLICDRDWFMTFAVDTTTDAIVWSYGTYHLPGTGVDHLEDAYYAVPLANGNVLIADNLDGNRVLEVRASDYDPAKPNDGYTASSIVWSYGRPANVGTAPDQLYQPRSPQRLANGDTLITDAGADNPSRVIEVRSSDHRGGAANDGYTESSIVWQFPKPGSGTLSGATMATRIESGALKGETMIVDTGNKRILFVNAAGSVVDQVDTQTLEPPASSSTKSDPRSAMFAPNSRLIISDPGFQRVIAVGYQPSVSVTSSALVLPDPTGLKAFSRLKVQGSMPVGSGTSISLRCSVNGGATWVVWHTRDGFNFYPPSGTAGRTLAYEVTLHTTQPWNTPQFSGISLFWQPALQGGSGGGGGGKKPGAGANTGGSGAFTFPTSGTGGTGTSGTGSGAGTSGTGSGAGGSGFGTGSSGGGSGAATTGAQITAPQSTATSGQAPQSVSGLQVQGVEGVSGIPLKAAGGAQSPAPKTPGPKAPLGVLAAIGGVILAAFIVPWPVMAARLRGITGFDHTRPKRYPPFRPLG